MLNKLGFDFSHFKGDFFGGLTAGIVALPLALAFGVQSGLGPSAGLYGAIFIAFFAALFGGTNTQISGPTAPMTALSTLIVAGIVASFDGDVAAALPSILVVFLLSGLIQIALGVIGLGKYIKYMPYPVVSGFMTAIGVIILITQIAPAVGYYPGDDTAYVETFKPLAEEKILEGILMDEVDEGILVLENFEETIKRSGEVTNATIMERSTKLAADSGKGVIGSILTLPKALKNIKWLELILTLATIFIIYGFKRITTAIPSALVALLVVSGVAYFGNFDYYPIKEIPAGFPTPRFDMFTGLNFASITPYLLSAVILAFLGAIDSLLTSIVADNMTKTKHQPNKELIGQGIGNSIAAFFGGLPGAGATIRTVVNINSGGKTRLSGMIAGILLLTILIALGPTASKIPAAVLAGILITVGIGVMDYKGLKAIPYMPSSEVAILLIVMVLSTVWNLVYAVGIGLVIAALIFMKKIGDFTAKKSEVKPLDEDSWSDEVDFPKNLKEEVFIKHVEGPLFFGYTSDFQDLANQIPHTADALVVRMEKSDYMDQSGLYAMEDILMDLINNDVRVLFVGVPEQPRYMMERIDLIPNLVSEDHIFDNFEDCLKWITQNVEDKYPPPVESGE